MTKLQLLNALTLLTKSVFSTQLNTSNPESLGTFQEEDPQNPGQIAPVSIHEYTFIAELSQGPNLRRLRRNMKMIVRDDGGPNESATLSESAIEEIFRAEIRATVGTIRHSDGVTGEKWPYMELTIQEELDNEVALLQVWKEDGTQNKEAESDLYLVSNTGQGANSNVGVFVLQYNKIKDPTGWDVSRFVSFNV